MIHPGPRAAERVQARRTRLVPVAGTLPARRTVMEGVAALFEAAGCKGGMVSLDRVGCAPLRYVLPAHATDGVHGAWYSETHELGRATILRATAVVGQKEGASFLHCHGIWQGRGEVRMGHLLPLDSVLTEDAPVTGLGARDAWFEALPDEETAFTLFQPQGGAPASGLIARILPGEDVTAGIETLCAAHGIFDARIHGVGSIDHIRFADGSRMDCHATELMFRDARVTGGRAHLPIEVVDIDGRIAAGILARGGNPVGVTLELLIEPVEAP
ncbi:DUF296 domain-containing protein [Paracoccus sp. S-4012]|nr:DUF296 domain-containing protein [Paracoccus sp. S-4012]